MDTSRPVTVVSESTGSIREVEVSPVVSTTTERTWTRLVGAAIRLERWCWEMESDARWMEGWNY